MTKNKTIVKCLRLTEEDASLIAYLKSVNIRWTNVVYPEIHDLLVEKCREMKIREAEEYSLPF